MRRSYRLTTPRTMRIRSARRGLEELVARIGLEHVQHRLAVVACGVEAEVLDDALDLTAQHRDVARAAVIGGRGPQTEEAVLAVDASAASKVLTPT